MFFLILPSNGYGKNCEALIKSIKEGKLRYPAWSAWSAVHLLNKHNPFRVRHKLSAPVVKVGNLARGGRAKTPTVVALAKEMQHRGYFPVVLTRGYKSQEGPQFLLPGMKENSGLAARAGDEAVEIFARTGVPVLVGANRGRNAKKFEEEHSDMIGEKRLVYILDDGFQHYDVQGDISIVNLREKDLTEEPNAWDMREAPEALKDADFGLVIGRDLVKQTELQQKPPSDSPLMALTTRGDVNGYFPTLRKSYPDILERALENHADRGSMVEALKNYKGRNVILGGKEAVKIFEGDERRNFFEKGIAKKEIDGKTYTFYFADLRLKIDEQKFWIPFFRQLSKAYREASRSRDRGRSRSPNQGLPAIIEGARPPGN